MCKTREKKKKKLHNGKRLCVNAKHFVEVNPSISPLVGLLLTKTFTSEGTFLQVSVNRVAMQVSCPLYKLLNKSIK